MKKFALLIVAFALLVSACGAGDSELAASVDGTEYTVGDVNALVFDSGETVSKDQFAQFLGFLIQWDIVTNAAENDFEISFTEEEINQAGMDIYETNAQPGITFEGFLEANAVSEEFLYKVAHLQLVEAELGEKLAETVEPPSEEDIEAQRQASYDSLTEVCVKHILVETMEESDDVFARLEDGEAFEDLAMELSTDTGSGQDGGDLGCSSPTRYVPGFLEATIDAELDVPYGPVETQFGYHTVLVTDRTFPEDDQLPTDEEIVESLSASQLPTILTGWIGDKLAAAEVVVEEKFGTWQTEPAGVIPPSDDPTPSTEAPSDQTTTTVAEQTDQTTTTVAE